MKKLLIVVGAFAMMYWAYKAGERAAIRSCVEDLEEPGEKRDGEAAEPATPEQGADADGIDREAALEDAEKGVSLDNDVSNFIGMNANL